MAEFDEKSYWRGRHDDHKGRLVAVGIDTISERANQQVYRQLVQRYERLLDRFAREAPALVPTGSQPSFRLEARVHRIVADDGLVGVLPEGCWSRSQNSLTSPQTASGLSGLALQLQNRLACPYRSCTSSSRPTLPSARRRLTSVACRPPACSPLVG